MELDSCYAEIERLWPEPGESPSEEVMDLCLKAVTKYPKESALWYNLGILLERSTGTRGFSAEDFLRCFENAVDCDSNSAEAQNELGFVLDVYFDDYGKAEQAFRRAIELGAGYESYFGRARVLAQMGRTDEAIHSLSEKACPFHDHPEIKNLQSEIVNGEWFWTDHEGNGRRGITD